MRVAPQHAPTESSHPPPDRAQVEREQRRRSAWPLPFAAAIEQQFRRDGYARQHRAVAMNWLVGVLLYDSFLLSDWVVDPAAFSRYAVGRLCVMTPLCLAVVAWILRSRRGDGVMVCLPPVAMTATLSVLIAQGDGDYRVHYLFGDILIMMCGCVLSRLRTVPALLTVGVQCLFYLAILLSTDIVPAQSRVVSMLFCFSGGMVSVLSALALEHGSRQSFLLGLRAQFLNRELETMAMTDPLTGVANRRAAARSAETLWNDPRLRAGGIAVLMADIDHFKRLNDRCGHAAGDLCIKQVAQVISGAVRQGNDIVSRHGGEEFLVVLPGADRALAGVIAERIRANVEALSIANPGADSAAVTLSVGVAFADGSANLERVTQWADEALYAAKSGGRNRVVVATRARVAEAATVG